jgi:hypothetical protein
LITLTIPLPREPPFTCTPVHGDFNWAKNYTSTNILSTHFLLFFHPVVIQGIDRERQPRASPFLAVEHGSAEQQ